MMRDFYRVQLRDFYCVQHGDVSLVVVIDHYAGRHHVMAECGDRAEAGALVDLLTQQEAERRDEAARRELSRRGTIAELG